MSEYKGEAVERREITVIAEQIVAALGTDWSVEQPPGGNRGVYLAGPDQQKLWIARGWDAGTKTRLIIHGDYPGTESYRVENHEITVAETRPPAAIAKEIERRLLPKYRETLATRLQQLQSDADARAAREAFADRIIEATGGLAQRRETHRGRPDPDRTEVFVPSNAGGNDHGYGTFTPFHRADRVTIELHNVPADVAVEIARVIGRKR